MAAILSLLFALTLPFAFGQDPNQPAVEAAIIGPSQSATVPQDPAPSEVIVPDEVPEPPPDEQKLEFSEYEKLLSSRYTLFGHHRTYVLPFSYIANPDTKLYEGVLGPQAASKDDYYRRAEAEFQISFFLPVYRKIAQTQWDLIMAYTHHSWWQVYNAAWSKPFRETNYNPELVFRKVDERNGRIADFDLAAYEFGYMHESNGQIDALSRSWDRVFARAYFYRPTLSMMITAWMRVPEDRRDDDNPTIERYMGIGSVELYKGLGRTTLELKFPIAEKLGFDLRFSWPWHDQIRGFITAHAGYGHSLIEYNRDTRRIGFGIALENFFDQ